jgi:peptide/nickel transport system substrate-binding protein
VTRQLAALALAAPLAAAAAPRPVPGGALRVLLPALPAALDPVLATSPSDLAGVRAVHAGLLAPGSDGAPRAALLEASPEPEEGGRAWRLRLAPGLTFHDGAPLRAADVAASLARLAGPRSLHPWLAAPITGAGEVRAGRADRLAGVEVLSDRELRIAVDHPFPAFPAALAAAPAAVTGPGGAGAGPFRPSSAAGGALHLLAFEGQARGRPFADALDLAAADARRATRELAARSAHAALRPEAAAPGARPTPPLGLLLAAVSPRLGAARPALREAVAAVDRADLARFLRGPATPLAGLLPDALLGGRTPPHRTSGVGGPLPARVRVLVPEGAESARHTAERLQVRLYDRGVRVAIEAAAPPTVAARLASGDHDLALVPVWLVSGEPALALAQVAFAAGGFGAAAGVLARVGDGGPDAVAREAAALEDALSLVPLCAEGLRLSAVPALQGLAAAGDGTFDPGDLWLLPEGALAGP